MNNVGRQMAVGAAWMVLFKFAERGLGLVSMIVLARLLVPGDFGLIAMATSFIAVLELIGSFGLDIALIRRRDATRIHYDTAWTLNVLTGTAVAVAMVALALPVAGFYDEQAVAPVILALALGPLVAGFENIGVVAFRIEMRFDREFRYQLAKKLAMFAVTVPLAVTLRSYWALVAGMVAGRAVGVLYSYRVHEYRPRFSLAARAELFGFSQWLLLNNALTFLRDRMSDFIIGRLRGRSALGLYSVGYEIANLPTTELVMPINRAVFPGYAQLHQGKGSLQDGYLAVIGLIALFALPAGAGVAATADLLTPIVLGSKWLDAAPLIAVLALSGGLLALQSNSYSVFLAVGKPQLQSIVLGVYVASLLPLMTLLVRDHGLVGAAWACIASAALMLPVNFALVLRELNLRPRHLGAVLWRPLLATAGMYGVLRAMRARWPNVDGYAADLVELGATVAAGLAVYAALAYGLWRIAGRPVGPESAVAERVSARWRGAEDVQQPGA
jgi:lipopolysaccharide exporter